MCWRTWLCNHGFTLYSVTCLDAKKGTIWQGGSRKQNLCYTANPRSGRPHLDQIVLASFNMDMTSTVMHFSSLRKVLCRGVCQLNWLQKILYWVLDTASGCHCDALQFTSEGTVQTSLAIQQKILDMDMSSTSPSAANRLLTLHLGLVWCTSVHFGRYCAEECGNSTDFRRYCTVPSAANQVVVSVQQRWHGDGRLTCMYSDNTT